MHRLTRVPVAALGGLLLCGAVLLAPGGGADAATAPAPTPGTRPPTTVRPPRTVPAAPDDDGTPTPETAPAVPTIPDDSHGELSALSPAQTLAAESEFARLTAGQRALVRQLQSAKAVLAVRRFALVALARDVSQARLQLEAARTAERQARARVDATVAQMERLKGQIVGLAVAAYRDHTDHFALGSLQAIDLGSANAITRATTYAKSDVNYLEQRLESLAVLERRLEIERQRAEAARAEAEASAAELEARLAEQRAAYDEAADASARAESAAVRGLGSNVGLVAQILDPRLGADSISGVLAFVQAGQPDPAALEGVFGLPIPGASLSSPFGMRIDPIAGSVAFHAGLDFAADSRTPIKAAAAGVVVIAGECGGYGSCVVIDHGGSLATLYGHQSQVLVRVGDTVAPGDTIGLVGSTGYSTGPHLHFEVRVHGAPIDPIPTLAG